MAYKQSPFPIHEGTSSHRSALKQIDWSGMFKKYEQSAEEKVTKTRDPEIEVTGQTDWMDLTGGGDIPESYKKAEEEAITMDPKQMRKEGEFVTDKPGPTTTKKGKKPSKGGGKGGKLPEYSDYLKKAALADTRSAWDVVK